MHKAINCDLIKKPRNNINTTKNKINQKIKLKVTEIIITKKSLYKQYNQLVKFVNERIVPKKFKNQTTEYIVIKTRTKLKQ